MRRKENTTKNSYSAKIFERSSFRVNQYMVWSGLEFPFFFSNIYSESSIIRMAIVSVKSSSELKKKAPQSSVIRILAYPAVACNVISTWIYFINFAIEKSW